MIFPRSPSHFLRGRVRTSILGSSWSHSLALVTHCLVCVSVCIPGSSRGPGSLSASTDTVRVDTCISIPTSVHPTSMPPSLDPYRRDSLCTRERTPSHHTCSGGSRRAADVGRYFLSESRVEFSPSPGLCVSAYMPHILPRHLLSLPLILRTPPEAGK